MVLLTTCSACLYGEHGSHTRVVQPVPEGIMGGMICDCKGECRDPQSSRRRPPPPKLDWQEVDPA